MSNSAIGRLQVIQVQEGIMKATMCSNPPSVARYARQPPPDPQVKTGLERLATTIHRNRGEEIHGSERPDDYWYRVVRGAARCYIVLPDGRRQVLDLLLPENAFTFAGFEGDFYGVDAIANNTTVACYPRREMLALLGDDPAVAKAVAEMAFDAMARSQQLIVTLGQITAREKVGAFLLGIMQRVESGNTDRLVLPMSRYDIADYLALSVETVSRSLTDLKQRGLISLIGPRRVQIVDRDRLSNQHVSDNDWAAD
jgi:CRP/FNR family transcriptional regulator, nitrogen fixation regulation protein